MSFIYVFNVFTQVHKSCCICVILFVIVFVIVSAIVLIFVILFDSVFVFVFCQVMSPHQSGPLSQKSQVSRIAL